MPRGVQEFHGARRGAAGDAARAAPRRPCSDHRSAEGHAEGRDQRLHRQHESRQTELGGHESDLSGDAAEARVHQKRFRPIDLRERIPKLTDRGRAAGVRDNTRQVRRVKLGDGLRQPTTPCMSRYRDPAITERDAHSTARAARPGKRADAPSSSSMRRSWLYLAMRSVRDAEPVLICPAPMATAKSAMKASSVSPERCEMMEAYFALRAISTASIVSVTLPI